MVVRSLRRLLRNARPARPALGRLALALALASALALGGCEGQGGSDGLVVRNEILVGNCTPSPSLDAFPAGLTVLSKSEQLATMSQTGPNAVVVFDLRGDRPRTLAAHTLGVDSDGDWLDDASVLRPVLGFALYPVMGEIQAIDDATALASTSNYEQVLVFDPTTGEPRSLTLELSASLPDLELPLFPAPGGSATRTGISTLACVHPTNAVDSTGQPIAPDARCDPARPGFLTSLTAGKARAGGRLFVATSNLARGTRFWPGTVLVFDWIEQGGALTVRPSAATPVLFTSGFNPTGMASFRTPGGRELVLVTATGVIGTGSGPGNVFSEAFVDVIDPSVPRIVATIPLGFAGPSFGPPAIDPTGRVAWLGASSSRQLYAIDLRVLDDARLYAGGSEPVRLDGLAQGGLDARIFTADRPFVLPPRSDGRASTFCEGLTDVTVNASGSEVYASDFCDGTLTRIALDLDGATASPYPPSSFRVLAQQDAFAPNDVVGELRAPLLLLARPGIPGIDYTSPDVVALLGQPDGQICGVRVESR
ncbi:MAG: hypothetical protein U0900_13535 [Myxococcota bacterium]